MDRREFLITTSGAAAVAASTAAATVAGAAEPAHEPSTAPGNARVFEMSMPWRDDGRGAGDSARRLARRIEEMTNGRYRIEITEGASSPNSVLWHGSAHDFADRHPAFAFFAGLPGTHGLPAPDFASWLAVGGGQMLWDDLASEAGFKPLLAGHAGATPPLWSAAPVASLSEIAGRKVQAPGLGAEVARALGADPTSLPPRDLVTALNGGALDIVEWGGLLASVGSGIAEHAKYATGTGFNTHGTALALHVSLDVWKNLPAGDKAIFEAAASQEFHESCAEARAHEAIAKSTLQSRHGVEFAPFPADVAEALKRVADATVAHVAGRDEASQRINQSYMAFKAMTDLRTAALV